MAGRAMLFAALPSAALYAERTVKVIWPVLVANSGTTTLMKHGLYPSATTRPVFVITVSSPGW